MAAFLNVQHVTLWEITVGEDWWAVLCFQGLWYVNEASGGVRFKVESCDVPGADAQNCSFWALFNTSGLEPHSKKVLGANSLLAAQDRPMWRLQAARCVHVFPWGNYHHHHHLASYLFIFKVSFCLWLSSDMLVFHWAVCVAVDAPVTMPPINHASWPLDSSHVSHETQEFGI